MPKALKTISLILVSVLLLTSIALFLVIEFVDPNTFKNQISQIVHDKTGRTLLIEGDIHWSFFPWLGVELNDARLGNAPGFTDRAFATVKKADVSIRLLPLLRSKHEIGKLTLTNLVLNLQKDENGKNNWNSLLAYEETDANGQKATSPKSSLLDINISTLDITNSTINWIDSHRDRTISLKNLAFNGRKIAPRKSFPLKLAFDLTSNKPELSGKMDLATTMTLDPEKQIIALIDVLLTSTHTNPKLSKDAIESTLQGNIDFNIKKQTLDMFVTLAKIDNLKAGGEMHAVTLFQKPTFKGKLSVAPFELKSLLEKYGVNIPKMQEPNALRTLALATEFNATSNDLAFKKLRLKIDNSSVTGDFAIKSFATFAYDFNLSVDELNVDSYMLADEKTESTKAAPAQQVRAKSTKLLIPSELLRKFKLTGSLTVGELTAAQLKITELNTKLSAVNGLIKISPITAKLYDGAYSGNLILDVRSDSPKLSILESAQDIHAGSFLKDLFNVDSISGTASLNAKLTTVGQTLPSLRRSVNGSASIAVKDGAYKGVDLGYETQRAVAFFQKQEAPKPSGSNQTKFGSLTASFKVTNGVAKTNDILLTSPQMQVTGKGSANLASEALSFKLIAAMVDQDRESALNKLQDLLGGGIPIHISGKFGSPKVTPDFETIAHAITKSVIRTQAEKIITKHLDEKLGKEILKVIDISILNGKVPQKTAAH